ncbi:MAG: LemA family protein [Firmicutes bacterium]|nr:LemA family protein [Bacillota bacterium]
MWGWIILIIVVIVVFAGLGIYNSLVKNRVVVREAFSTIDIYLKKRYDLIPNLVETVKGYATHEKETFENVTKARNVAMAASDSAGKIEANKQLSQSLMNLFAVAESYPDLKANVNFLDLQGNLSKLEEEIAFSRKYYNGTVRVYNTMVQQVPSNFVASLTGFNEEPFFETEEVSKTAPEVKF